jgi:hypothetical protein
MRKNFDSRALAATSRRDFLRLGAYAVGGVACASVAPAWELLGSPKSAIFVYLPGGPSHLDTYDMKPGAPAEIRGEFRPIATNVPGVRLCEHLPLHAKIADKFSIISGIETVDTHSPAVIMTGALAGEQRTSIADFNRVKIRELAPEGDWDTHGRVLGRRQSIFAELRTKLPIYDAAIYELITAIYDRGLDRDVLVVAGGEFGRTPWINRYGGRDHWAPCGSVLVAGGGLRMGQMVGDTGPIGEREQRRSRPYTARDVLTMIYRHLGLPPEFDGGRMIEELV